jgi:hypothetical protein
LYLNATSGPDELTSCDFRGGRGELRIFIHADEETNGSRKKEALVLSLPALAVCNAMAADLFLT